MHKSVLDAQPTLRGWLDERTPAERQTIAALWSLAPREITTGDLASLMLQPQIITGVITELSAAARQALICVQRQGGRVRAAVLEREYGAVRPHAAVPDPRAYLLALATPPSAVEQLFLRGLLLKQGDRDGGIYAIPIDLLSLLPPTPPSDGIKTLQSVAAPPTIRAADSQALEDHILALLRLAYEGSLATTQTGAFTQQALRTLARAWHTHHDSPIAGREEYWPYARFLRCVAISAGLLRYDAFRLLRPTPYSVAWLRQTRGERLRCLLQAWITSQWDELSDLLGIVVGRAETRDLPEARRALTSFLASVPTGVWLSHHDLIAAVKTEAPDFARPDGDYTAWQLRGRDRRPLDGFAHWDQVEGRQLATMIGVSLRWLALIDTDEHETTAFRIAPYGAMLFHNLEEPQEPPAEPIAVLPNFDVVVPDSASLVARFQIGRIATAGQNGARLYSLTRRSILAALDRGISIDEAIRFLHEQSANEIPQNVVVTLREWAGRYGRVRIRRAAVLASDDPLLLEQIRHDSRVRLPPVEPLNANTWLLADADAPLLAERLRRAGYAPAADDHERGPLQETDLTTIAAALEFYGAASRRLGFETQVSAALHRRVARLLSAPRRQQARDQAAAALERLRAATQDPALSVQAGDE